MYSIFIKNLTNSPPELHTLPSHLLNSTISHLKQHLYPTSPDFTLIYNGHPLPDSLILQNLRLKRPFPVIYKINSLSGGGNDGGSIPTRGEMVKIKKGFKRGQDAGRMRRKKWVNCALSKKGLFQPIVADELGSLFNKEDVIKGLLEKTLPLKFSHIKSLKDVHEVNFTWNSKYDPTKPAHVPADADENEAPFQCPVTVQPTNGQHPFSLLITCGHVYSEKGLHQILDAQNPTCFVCQKYFTKSDILALNPDEETQEKLREKLNQEVKSTKKEKKQKSEPKLKRKISSTNTDQSKQPQNPSKKQKNKDTIQGASNTLAVQAALEKVDSNHDAKKRMSETYKSIFTTPFSSTANPSYFTGTSRGVIK